MRRARLRSDGRLRRLVGVVVGVALAACFTAAPAASRKKSVPPPAVPPTMRLGDAVKPLAYDAELTIVPTQ